MEHPASYETARRAHEESLPNDALIPQRALAVMEDRLRANTGKHGRYHPLTVRERLAKIDRHRAKIAAPPAGDPESELDHLAAIACNAALAIEAHMRGDK